MIRQNTQNKYAARCFVLLCLYLTPVFDIVNGIFVNTGLISIGQAVHVLMLLGNIFFILLLGFRKSVYATIFSFLYFAVHILIQALFSNGSSIITDINYCSKLLLFLSEWFILKSCVDCKVITTKDFISFFKYSIVLIPGSIFFAELTSSAKLSYTGSVGTKGYFTSLNAITIILIVLVIMAVYFAVNKMGSWFWALLGIVSAFLLGSKSPFVFFAVALVLTILFNSKNRLKTVAYFAVIAVGCYILIHYFFLNKFLSIIQWQTSFMNTAAQTDNWIQYLLSGRNQLFASGWEVYVEHFQPFAFLFGIGPYTLQSGIGSLLNLSSLRGIEMDFMEIFFSYGAVVVIPLYYIILKAILWKLQDKSASLCDNLCLGSMLIFSIFGGHVLTEAISATYLAALIAFKYSKQEKPCNSKECIQNNNYSKYFKTMQKQHL